MVIGLRALVAVFSDFIVAFSISTPF